MLLTSPKRMACATCACALAVVLSLGLAPRPAHAQTLEELENAAIEASERYESARKRVDDLNVLIEKNEQRVSELEEELPAMRERCATAIRSSYKMRRGQSNLVSLILSADDFNEFISMLTYMDAVNEANSEDIEALATAESELKSAEAELRSAREEAEGDSEEAEAAYREAQSAVAAAKQRATAEAAKRKAAYEARRKAAEAAAKSESATDASGDPDDDSSSSSQVSEPKPSNGSATGSWKYVEASTYGEGDGFMYGITASGDTVTPTSMGVAMRTMPLGTTIEISYDGKAVRAVVNDRGPYWGNRQIDMQPAVAHALGFDGVDTVGYRVVG